MSLCTNLSGLIVLNAAKKSINNTCMSFCLVQMTVYSLLMTLLFADWLYENFHFLFRVRLAEYFFPSKSKFSTITGSETVVKSCKFIST